MNTHSRIGGKTCLAGAVLLLSASLLSGSEITLRAETEREDALYRSGEKIVFRVSLLSQLPFTSLLTTIRELLRME